MILAELARTHADSGVIAVRCGDRALTYAELDAASNRIAAALRAAGLEPGARVGYLGLESVDYYATLLGCAKSGTVLVPINFRLTATEIGYILADSGTALLVVDESMWAALGPLDIPVVLAEEFPRWYGEHPDNEAGFAPTADDAVVQLYTSGTTGLPKGVVLAHRSFFAVREALAEAGADWIDWRAGDIGLIGIPGFHVGGLWWATQGLAAGATMIAMPRFDAGTAVALIAELGITTVCVVPSMLRLMLDDPAATPAALASVRKVVYGGSPISESLLQTAIERLGCDFAQIYGLTETGNTAICLPPAAHVPGSPLLRAAGRCYPGFGVKIIGSDGAALAPGEVGEICLRTPGHMLEYWNRPEATAEALVDGWIHTGDAGYLDDDGYLYLCDRIKDMIIVAGENIYPAEIENTIAKHPAVADVAVIGTPDERFGERVHACVALRPQATATARELFLFCRNELAAFKIPSRFEFVDRVPRNPSGKILRRELRDRFWPAAGRRIN
ncbi:long-chain-fatty-acid--CoA ligase [Nocardia sp. CDC153]|uniref:long-chain-fatty-acid--CoA ligase n=1 Tax=Nocardia sp. CDC153 TaxID=3112167 RepID=UPI002DBC821A|nr:long-chain-fatty-acid--CoA ligase [Nocardia sp. CDC153]MEC3954109.1 long-chain-fatty-acid--CoA ligase [Nocardia sp. CDC153]